MMQPTKPCALFLLAAACCLIAGGGRTAEPGAPLVLEQTIPLKHVAGRIDHLAIDLGRKRLFVAELGNGTLDAIDLSTGAVVHRIEGLRQPQGLGYAPAADVLAAASAGDGSVRLFRGQALTPAGTVNLGDDADNVRLDPVSGTLIVGFGSGGLAVIDPTKASVISRIALPAHPEGFQLDGAKRQAFVNIPDAHQIAVVDLGTDRQTARWKIPGLEANFPMALDPAHSLAAVAFRSPPRLVTFDTGVGTPTNTLPACADADDVFFDVRRRRIYVSCGDGHVDTWQQEGSEFRRLALTKTASGARTSLFVPELDRLFVAARAGFFGLASDAAILVYRPAD